MNLHNLLFWFGIILPTIIVLLTFSVFLICWFRQGCSQPCWFSKRSAAEEACRTSVFAEVNRQYQHNLAAMTVAGIIPRSNTKHSHLSLTNTDSSGSGGVAVPRSNPMNVLQSPSPHNDLFVMSYLHEDESNSSWDKYMLRDIMCGTGNSQFVMPSRLTTSSELALHLPPVSNELQSSSQVPNVSASQSNIDDLHEQLKLTQSPPELPPRLKNNVLTSSPRHLQQVSIAITHAPPKSSTQDTSQSAIGELESSSLAAIPVKGSDNYGFHSDSAWGQRKHFRWVAGSGSSTDSSHRELLDKSLHVVTNLNYKQKPLRVPVNNNHLSVITAQMHYPMELVESTMA